MQQADMGKHSENNRRISEILAAAAKRSSSQPSSTTTMTGLISNCQEDGSTTHWAELVPQGAKDARRTHLCE